MIPGIAHLDTECAEVFFQSTQSESLTILARTDGHLIEIDWYDPEHIGELILEKDMIDPSKTKIICNDIDTESDTVEWRR